MLGILKLVGEVSEYTKIFESTVFIGKCWKCNKCGLSTYEEYRNYYFIPLVERLRSPIYISE